LEYFLQSIIDFSAEFVHQYAPIYFSTSDHLSQHKDILEALQARDPVRCRQALEFHLYNVAENIEIAMQASQKDTPV
jgi:DNA-binding GntR family transcriptional regulator